MSDTSPRVERGAQLLDERLPGWEKRIDLDTLALDSGCRCVLGQLYGDYDKGLDRINGEAERHPVAFGFIGQVNEDYKRLTDKWKRAVRRRLRRRVAA